MQQLSALDALFLHLETSSSPMHVGGVSIFTPEKKGARIDYEKYREFLSSRLHLVRTTRERLVMVPFGLGSPYWVEDPNFDLDFHLHHMALPAPGGWKELCKLAAHIFAIPLDRERPLWEFTIVEGLNTIEGIPEGSIALISKIHHAAIDGASGTEMASAILDPTPQPKELPTPIPWKSEPLPTGQELLQKTLSNIAQNPIEFFRMIPDTLKSIATAGALWKIKKIKPPSMPFVAPRTIFNHTVTPHRVWDSATFDLPRVKKIKNALEMTVNDIVLGICSGALRKYLLHRGKLPKQSLTAMLPVNVREEHEQGTQGNKVSGLIVKLATNQTDIQKRVETIHDSTVSSKIYHNATDAKKLIDYNEFIPYSLGNLASRFYTSFDISQKINPVFNLVITNVPGPQFPLYFNGAKMLRNMGMAPILDGLGLLIVIQSYNGTLSISSTSCKEIMPDIEVFTEYLRESLAEIEEYALPSETKATVDHSSALPKIVEQATPTGTTSVKKTVSKKASTKRTTTATTKKAIKSSSPASTKPKPTTTNTQKK